MTPRYAFVCNGVVAGVFAATGQTGKAGSRLLVQRSVHDALVDRIVRRATSIRLGDPRANETEMGPLANEPQYRKVVSFFVVAGEEVFGPVLAVIPFDTEDEAVGLANESRARRAPSGPKTSTAATG